MTLSTVLVVHSGAIPPWARALDSNEVTLHDSIAERHALAKALDGVDVALIDSSASVAASARIIHELEPTMQVAVIVAKEDRDALRRAILFAPGVGELWIEEPSRVSSAFVERAADITRQRRRFQLTQSRITAEHPAVNADEGLASLRSIVSEAFLAGLLRALPDPVFTVDQSGHVLSSNQAGDRVLASAGAGARTAPLWATLVPEVQNPLDGIELETTTLRAERRQNGDRIERWDLHVTPIRAGDVHAWAVVAHDLTDHLRVQAQLEEQGIELEAQTAELEVQKIELEERADAAEVAQAAAERAQIEAAAANAAKSQFLATMSHELRTPLNAIIGYAQLLELQIASLLNDSQRMYLQRLQTSGAHLLGLINDILDLSKIEAGGMVVHADNNPTRHVVSETAEMLAPTATERGVELTIEGTDDDVQYTGDVARVRQIVANLLSNAVKFTEPGGRVTLSAGLSSSSGGAKVIGDGPWALIRVRDTGIGIPEPMHDTVFEPFVQVASGPTRTSGGTGLGLAISRRLARLMGGDLTLESAPGNGSTFTLTLPAPDISLGEGSAPKRRAARARRGVMSAQQLNLRETGVMLRGQLQSILESFVARIRADAAFVDLRRLPPEVLEDHVGPFIADLAQALIIANDTGDLETAAMRDGKDIHRVIADAHGRQRKRLGLTEAQVIQEYRLLMEELTDRLEREDGGRASDKALALALLGHLVGEAREQSRVAMREERT